MDWRIRVPVEEFREDEKMKLEEFEDETCVIKG